jgi:hypothetical protein
MGSCPSVSPASLLLSALIVLRLFMPPGICVCKLSSPASRLLAAVCGRELPVIPGDEADDDHNPGCPAFFLAQGLGVAPPSGPGPILLPPAGVVSNSLSAVYPLADGLCPSPFSTALSADPIFGETVRPLLC